MRKLLCCALPLCAALAQHYGPSAEKPVTLLPGLGIYRHPIATSSEEAQKFFDQGLRLLYGFNRYEALRSFRKAAELDPKAVMPRRGMAMAQGPHINMDVDGDLDMKGSCDAVREGLALREGAPEYERAWIDAVSARCSEYDERKYRDAMRELARRYPDDLDAAVFYAESVMIPHRWRWFQRDGTPKEGMAEAIHMLEAVMRRLPEHPGANHFYIHAVEMSPSPEQATPSAQWLMGVVPAAGHLVHMPGHIWLILGDYELTAATNERAAQVDREYMERTGVSASAYAGYYIHNLQFVAVARQMQGRWGDAIRAAEAEEVLREGLRRTPRNGRILFALMESLKAQDKAHAAALVRGEFEAAWSRPDVKLRLEDL